MSQPDFHVINHGSIFTLRAITKEARHFIELNLPEDFSGAIEPRFFPKSWKELKTRG